MKPRLLKFSCQSCGTKLAVPVTMAGLSDHCPKCGALVTSPRLPQEEAPTAPAPKKKESWSADELKDALRPEKETVKEIPPEILAALVPAPPEIKAEVPPPADSLQTSDLEAKTSESPSEPEVDDSEPKMPVLRPVILPPRRPHAERPSRTFPIAESSWRGAAPRAVEPPSAEQSEPIFTTKHRPEPEPEDRIVSKVLSAPVPAPSVEAAPPKVENTVAKSPANALEPADFDKEDEEAAAMPGMGEMLAAEDASGSAAITQNSNEPLPWLHGPFSDVAISRKKKFRRSLYIALFFFLLIDITLVFLFQKPLMDKWNSWFADKEIPAVSTPAMAQEIEKENVPQAVSETPSPSSPETSAKGEGEGFEPVQKEPAPVPPDISTAPATLHAVPMAIPIPSNVPAEPMPEAPPAAPEPAAATPPPAPEMAANSPATVSPAPAESASPTEAVPAPPADMALPNGSVAAAPVPEPQIENLPPEANEALELIRKFLNAKTWSERAAYSQRRSALQDEMEKYARENGDGPIPVGLIKYLERYPSKNGNPAYAMFLLSGGVLKYPVLTFLVEKPGHDEGGIDWQAFVEFKDARLQTFMNTPGAPSQKFRVLIKRAHFFGKGVYEVDKKVAFELRQPNADFAVNAFIPKTQQISATLVSQLGWDKDMPATLELVWRSKGADKWVEIQSIVRYGWRS